MSDGSFCAENVSFEPFSDFVGFETFGGNGEASFPRTLKIIGISNSSFRKENVSKLSIQAFVGIQQKNLGKFPDFVDVFELADESLQI